MKSIKTVRFHRRQQWHRHERRWVSFVEHIQQSWRGAIRCWKVWQQNVLIKRLKICWAMDELCVNCHLIDSKNHFDRIMYLIWFGKFSGKMKSTNNSSNYSKSNKNRMPRRIVLIAQQRNRWPEMKNATMKFTRVWKELRKKFCFVFLYCFDDSEFRLDWLWMRIEKNLLTINLNRLRSFSFVINEKFKFGKFENAQCRLTKMAFLGFSYSPPNNNEIVFSYFDFFLEFMTTYVNSESTCGQSWNKSMCLCYDVAIAIQMTSNNFSFSFN